MTPFSSQPSPKPQPQMKMNRLTLLVMIVVSAYLGVGRAFVLMRPFTVAISKRAGRLALGSGGTRPQEWYHQRRAKAGSIVRGGTGFGKMGTFG